MGVAAGPKTVTDGLVFALDARNAKTYDEIPGITDHGISDWYCFKSGTATYSAIYSNTEIIEIDADGNEVGIVTTGSDPQRGSITITAGKRYYGTKAIHILDEGVQDAIAPVSFAGTYFGNRHIRFDPKTMNIYAPQDDINVSVYEDVAGGVTGTATSTFSVSKGSSATFVTTLGQNRNTIFKTDKPAIMTVGSSGDDHLMQPMSQYVYRRRYDSARPGRTINNTQPSNLNDNTYILYDTSLPVFSLEVGDGAGGDSTQGIGYEYLSDTFSWGNVLSDYQIVAPYADTTVTVSYWANSQWNVGEVHSLSGTQTNPDAAFREGSTGFGSPGNTALDSGQAANLASNANLWKWESTKPIALIINDSADDEENMLGWMSNKYLRTSSNSTQSFVNLIKPNNRKRMKMRGKRLTNSTSYAAAKLSVGDYIEFDGIDDHIILPNFDGFPGGDNPFSLSFWFYSDATASANPEVPFFYGNEATGQAIRIRLSNNGSITAGHWGGSGYDWSTSSGVWTLSAWNYLAETYDGTTDRLYVNGVEVGNSNINNLSIPTSSNLILGKRPSGEIYGGQISQVSIYNRALTASEIQQNFNATRSRFGI